MAVLKYSRQRESIKNFLDSRCDHPTADTVYENIREIYPNISLGTVYRNLALLVSIGEVIKITTAQGPDRFDARTAPHNHFICKECQQVLDLEMEDIDYIESLASRNFQGKIDSHTTHFFGICENCMKKVKNTVDKELSV